ncbi:hypothetical protein [Actinomadura parmotrematis]|uniref:Uncharacterized protein n=1 Tax=Actinomadura parmotrematis TaxID=2864039 RepID=A0ABS7FP94_9ACTN|nr:hypothetical protein [Actinomadura parmotrematis]MBW8482203.1 hypothetical protein [Actinomadura parmotrematis]
MKAFSNADLAALTGEVLPERAVLSTLMAGGGDSYNNNNGAGGLGLDQGSTIVTNACQSNISRPDAGLLQLVGLHAQNDTSSFVCQPGSVASGH